MRPATYTSFGDVQSRPVLPRSEIMPLLFDKIARHTDHYLSIDDLATAENISERTFWNMFLEYFGVLL